MSALLLEKLHRLHSVADHVQMDRSVGVAQGFPRQPGVTGAVFDQQHLDRQTTASDRFHDCPLLPVRANRNVEPRPGSDSTEMLPPCRSTIFLQIDKPMPVPAK